MKWKRTQLNCQPCLISECGNYKIVKHGFWGLYKKIKQYHNGKIFFAFGDSVEHDTRGNTKKYKTLKDVIKRANEILTED